MGIHYVKRTGRRYLVGDHLRNALDPTPFGTLILQIDGSTLSGTADGASVSTWPGIIGPSFATASGKTSPTYLASGVNGQPGLFFPATTTGMSETSLSVTASFTMFVAVTATTLRGAAVAQRTVQSTASNWLVGPYGDQWSVFNGSNFLPNRTAAVAGQIAIITVTASGTYYTWRLNGIDKGGLAGTANPTYLALSGVGTYNEPWIGVIYEMLVYKPSLSDPSTVETYLKSKYGMI